MEIKLCLQTLFAAWSPAKVYLADNDELKVQLIDYGRIKNQAYLLFNGKALKFKNGELTLKSDDIERVNVVELQERDGDGKVLWRCATDKLIRSETDREYAETKLEGEVDYWKGVADELARRLSDYELKYDKLAERILELENGKFTVLKFNKGE